jgi:hypothetical protein
VKIAACGASRQEADYKQVLTVRFERQTSLVAKGWLHTRGWFVEARGLQMERGEGVKADFSKAVTWTRA